MQTLQLEQTISIDDLRRSFGEIKKKLPFINFIITDRGKEIGMLSATRTMKKELMMQTAGAWKGTELDDDDLWKNVLKRTSRKKPLTL